MTAENSPCSPVVGGRRRTFCCHSATLSGAFPPNSLAAVEECLAARVPRLEVDVRFLADDSLLVFHDESFEHDTTGSGRVSERVRTEVAAIRYRADESHGVCFLEDVVERTAGTGTLLQVDLKLMRAITWERAQLLLKTLEPLRDNLIVGSQAHWNLRRLEGVPLALDPTLQWHYDPHRRLEEVFPRRLGVHGLWDDSPIAANPRVPAAEYLEARIADIEGLLPTAIEWMVDIGTILEIASLGLALGDRLRSSGRSLAAWTLRAGTPRSQQLVDQLFRLGVETIITDVPLLAAASFDAATVNRV